MVKNMRQPYTAHPMMHIKALEIKADTQVMMIWWLPVLMTMHHMSFRHWKKSSKGQSPISTTSFDIEQFKEYANIYFFVLSSDEESHKERFVKRAVQIHRGGKQLDFFRENRIIHDHLLKQAQEYDVNIINTESIDKTLEKILSVINKSCTTANLINSVDELEDVIDIIINQNSGSIEKITYNIKGFKEPLVRNVSVSDSESAEKFIEKINEDKSKKEYLTELYKLSEYRKTVICASNQEKLDKIIKELTDKGYVLNE